jgi:hypothetical protein
MRRLIVICCCLCLAPAVFAQGLLDSSSVVTAVAVPDTVRAGVGTRLAFDVVIDVAAGWHLYAHDDPRYYGIGLAGLDSLPLAGVAVTYPQGREGKFLGETVRLLSAREVVHVSGFLASTPQEPLYLELECQACDDKSCLAPAWLPLSVVVLPEE